MRDLFAWPVRWRWVRTRRVWWKPWTWWRRWVLVDLTYAPPEHPMCRCAVIGGPVTVKVDGVPVDYVKDAELEVRREDGHLPSQNGGAPPLDKSPGLS